MKKLLLGTTLILGMSYAAEAQIPAGRIAPDFTLTDINGQSHQLYKYLDSGYSVMIDISATWCGPCWNFHNSHVMDSLEKKYGYNGTVSPKKIKVFFIEGDVQTTSADLNGTGSNTQGNWVAGSHYTIIDQNNAQTSALLNDYGLTAFPSLYFICPDRLVKFSQAGTSSATMTESFWVNHANGCPTLPSQAIDAKAVPSQKNEAFLCEAKPTVTFQNWGTSPLTNATINVYNNNAIVATQSWTGSLASKEFATVPINTAFVPTNRTNYDVEVIVSGDATASNNKSTNIPYKTLIAADAYAIPYMQNWTGVTSMPTKYITRGEEEENLFVFSGNSDFPLTGPDGVRSNPALAVQLLGTATGDSLMITAGINNQAAANSTLEFDHAYARRSGSSTDKLEVFVSVNCGTSWTRILDLDAATLSSAPNLAGTFVPSSASQWKHFSASLNDYKSASTWIKFKWTDGGSNYAWLDNLNINTSPLSVKSVIAENDINIVPNPASDQAIVKLNLLQSSSIAVQVVDIVGKTVASVPAQKLGTGAQQIVLNTSSLVPGVYYVVVSANGENLTQKLTITK